MLRFQDIWQEILSIAIATSNGSSIGLPSIQLKHLEQDVKVQKGCIKRSLDPYVLNN